MFDGPGSKEISDTWTLGEPGSRSTEWAAVHILKPNDFTSDKASFSVVCDPESTGRAQPRSSVLAPAHLPLRGTRVIWSVTRLNRWFVGGQWPWSW